MDVGGKLFRTLHVRTQEVDFLIHYFVILKRCLPFSNVFWTRPLLAIGKGESKYTREMGEEGENDEYF